MSPHGPHIEEGTLEALLDGALRKAQARAVRQHLDACPSCMERYRDMETLFAALAALPRLEPTPGFAARVMARVPAPAASAVTLPALSGAPLAARVRGAVRALVGGLRRAPHLAPELLGAWVDGELAPAAGARVERHLVACERCAGEVQALRAVGTRLGSLPRFAPSDGFAERVMARVQVPAPSAVAEESPAGSRVLGWAARLAPRSRRAWAVLAGASVTPAVTFALVLYAVFSHPEVTPGALVSFLLWKADEVVGRLAGSLSGALGGAGDGAVGGLVQVLSGAPWVAAALLVLYVAACALALRLLYRHIIAPNLTGSRYVRAIAS